MTISRSGFATMMRAICGRRWYAVALAWVVVLSGWYWVQSQPDRYAVSTRIYLDTQALLKPLVQGLPAAPDEAQKLDLITGVLLSREILEKVVKLTDFSQVPQTPEQTARRIDALRSAIGIVPAGRSNEYLMTYHSEYPELAKISMQALLATFFDSDLTGNAGDPLASRQFLEEQVRATREKLLQTEEALKNFEGRHAGLSPAEGRGYYLRLAEMGARMHGLEAELQEARQRRERLILQLQYVKPQLMLGPGLGRGTERAAPIANPVYQQLTIAVAKSDAQIAVLQSRLDEGIAGYESLHRAASHLPALEAEFTRLMREYNQQKTNYQMLLQRRDTASFQGNSAAGIELRVISPPRVSDRPVEPDRALQITFVFLIATVAATGLALFIKFYRRVVTDRRSLRELTGLPLLGAVSLIETPLIRRRRHQAHFLYYAAVAGLPVAFMLMLFTQVYLSRMVAP